RAARRQPWSTLLPYTTLFRSHGMDGEEHRNRKAIFVRAAMDPDALRELMADAQREWTAYIDREWVAGEGGTVYDAAVDVYGRSIDRKSTRLNSSHVKISYAVF